MQSSLSRGLPAGQPDAECQGRGIRKGLGRKTKTGTPSGVKGAQNTPQGPKDSSELKTFESQQQWEEAFF